MKIGNIHLPAISAADRPPGDRRVDGSARTGAHRAIADTGDLLSLSSGVGLLTVIEPAGAERSARLDALSKCWHSGTYRPDVARIAERLLEWGFDSPEAGPR
jgi:hypothetical protein